MNPNHAAGNHDGLIKALSAKESSVRLQGALAAGTNPDPAFLDALVDRCAIEPDFFVRDMLTWALTRLPPQLTLSRLRLELESANTQARSQSLHTLSKINHASTWPWITRDMLHDPDDEVARTAWRAAVVLVPEGEEAKLADELVKQLGRGDGGLQLSLSRALIGLGETSRPVVVKAANHSVPSIAAHARVTEVLRQDPELGFEAALDEAKRIMALGQFGSTTESTQGGGTSIADR